jgi:sulfite reductase (ferredoxin)
MPFYTVLARAHISEGQAQLAQRLGAIPAKRIPQFVAEAIDNGLADKQRLAGLVEKYGKLPDAVPEDCFYDFGQNEPFSLAGRGPGECGAGVMDVIRVDIDQAKDAIAEAGKMQTNKSEQIYKALVAAARALLVVFGLEPKKDREVFSAFSEHLIKPGWVKSKTQQMLDYALDWRMGEESSIEDLLPEVEELVERVGALFVSLDSNLKFRVEPYSQKTEDGRQRTENKKPESVHSIDLRGVACPLNFVKAKLALEKINTGEILEMLLDEGEPAANVPASFTEQGQDVIEIEKRQNFYCIRVRRKK